MHPIHPRPNHQAQIPVRILRPSTVCGLGTLKLQCSCKKSVLRFHLATICTVRVLYGLTGKYAHLSVYIHVYLHIYTHTCMHRYEPSQASNQTPATTRNQFRSNHYPLRPLGPADSWSGCRLGSWEPLACNPPRPIKKWLYDYTSEKDFRRRLRWRSPALWQGADVITAYMLSVVGFIPSRNAWSLTNMPRHASYRIAMRSFPS